VENIGTANDVVKVSVPHWNNVLKPKKLAEIVTDDEVEAMADEIAAKKEAAKAEAAALAKEIDGTLISFNRKAGPAGQLFGSVQLKEILDEIRSGNDNFLLQRAKVAGLYENDGNKLKGDIKDVGKYEATIKLPTDATATVKIEVTNPDRVYEDDDEDDYDYEKEEAKEAVEEVEAKQEEPEPEAEE